MKKTILLTAVFSVVMAMFAGCTALTGSGKKDPIGSKAATEPKAVGDIVFNDGSASPYTAELTLTDEQKAAAIAVVFKVDGDNVLGIGLKHTLVGIAWCTNDAKAYSKNISTIACTLSGSAGNWTFTGDTDGSDNLKQIADSLGEENDTADSSKYPAFYYAKNYKNVTGSNVKGTDYADGWYMPTVSELLDLWKEKATVDAAIKLCGGNELLKRDYWSSNQNGSFSKHAYIFRFEDGSVIYSTKDTTENFYLGCCIRSFN